MSNGLLYGLTAGLFGGSLWALLTSVVLNEAFVVPRWIVIGGEFLCCILAGFIVGVFNAPRLASERAPSLKVGHSLVHRILTAIGWFLYRLLVGWFVGILAMAVFSLGWFTLFAGGHFLFHLDRDSIDRSSRIALLGSMAISVYGSFSGGVFGALATTRRSLSHRPAIGSRATRSSFLAFLFGVLFGASLGWLPPEDASVFLFICLAASVPIGILSGILGGIWTDVRNSRGTWNR